jgi:hypothetical protein
MAVSPSENRIFGRCGFCGDALADLGGVVVEEEWGVVGVGVHVDEPGGQDQAGEVSGGQGGRQGSRGFDGGDVAVFDEHVRGAGWGSGAVDELGSGQQQWLAHGVLPRGWCLACGGVRAG